MLAGQVAINGSMRENNCLLAQHAIGVRLPRLLSGAGQAAHRRILTLDFGQVCCEAFGDVGSLVDAIDNDAALWPGRVFSGATTASTCGRSGSGIREDEAARFSPHLLNRILLCCAARQQNPLDRGAVVMGDQVSG